MQFTNEQNEMLLRDVKELSERIEELEAENERLREVAEAARACRENGQVVAEHQWEGEWENLERLDAALGSDAWWE